MQLKLIALGLLALLLAGCAGTPDKQAQGPTPAEVVATDQRSGEVHWGGTIIQVRNLQQRSLVEVLALPLAEDGRPRVDGQPGGRFIVERAGFIEPHEYAAGRLLEVRGRLAGFTEGSVGEAAYRFPVVIGEQLVLWPRDERATGGRYAPRINFGIGAGSGGGGFGVGIGF